MKIQNCILNNWKAGGKLLETVNVRLAVIDDGQQIIKLLKRIAQWMHDQGINQWQYLLSGGDDKEILESVEQQETYIVLCDEKIIATFTLSHSQSDWDRHIFGESQAEDSVYLHRLAIIPSHMGKGIGKEIVTWIESNYSTSTDKTFLKLDCVAENSKLNQFYLDNGFQYIGETDKHSKYQKKL